MGMWKKLYTTYIRPYLEFAVPVWSSYLKCDIAKLEGVQRRTTNCAMYARKEVRGKTNTV